MRKSQEQCEAIRERAHERAAEKRDADRRILEIAEELHLTWEEFDQTMELVRKMAHLSA